MSGSPLDGTGLLTKILFGVVVAPIYAFWKIKKSCSKMKNKFRRKKNETKP